MRKGSREKVVIGRREWVALPQLGVPLINAKVDTGAYSSCLHAEGIELYEEDGLEWVRFVTHDHRGQEVECRPPVLKEGIVKSSTGRSRRRIFIRTTIRLGRGIEWRVRLSLADRTEMRWNMLLGRKALVGRFVVDPGRVDLLGRVLEEE